MTEFTIRSVGFIAVFVAMVSWEHFASARSAVPAMWRRRVVNLSMAAMGTMLVRLLVPAGLASAAYLSAHYGIGLFTDSAIPAAVTWPVTVIVLDLAVYWQHRAFHRWPALWRLHAVHHADTGVDVTTGIRFHPVEIVLSLAWKSVVVALLGAPAGAAVLFEFVLSTTALVTHGNVRLPETAEKWARYVFVTPTLHRIHHSLAPDEREHNYGFSLSCWDRLFGTLRGAARTSDQELAFGIPGLSAQMSSSLGRMLLLPLRNSTPSR